MPAKPRSELFEVGTLDHAEHADSLWDERPAAGGDRSTKAGAGAVSALGHTLAGAVRWWDGARLLWPTLVVVVLVVWGLQLSDIVEVVGKASTRCLGRIARFSDDSTEQLHVIESPLEVKTRYGTIATRCEHVLSGAGVLHEAWNHFVGTSWVAAAGRAFGTHAEYHLHSFWVWIAMLLCLTYAVTHLIRTFTWTPALERAQREAVLQAARERHRARDAKRPAAAPPRTENLLGFDPASAPGTAQ